MSNLRAPSSPAAIVANFAEYRLVKTRGVLALIIEVPVERQAEAFAALGFPQPGTEIPVAVARLVEPPDEPSKATLRGVTFLESLPPPAPPTPPIQAILDAAKRLDNRPAPDRSAQAKAHYASLPECYERFLAMETQYKMDTGQMAEAR